MTTDPLYLEKDAGYYGLVREDVIDLIPPGTLRLLDIGCGTGETGWTAKRRLEAKEVVGIEYFEPAARAAREKLDRVIVGDVEQIDFDFPDNHFDCILCADILEHTKNPWRVLEKLRRVLREDGVLIASIPNIRHIVPVARILFDRFEYQESGVLDKSHLRFFTLHTIRLMFKDTGFSVIQVKTNRSKSWKMKLLNVISLGFTRQFSIYQYLVTCRKIPQ